jgi:hypothetical protein
VRGRPGAGRAAAAGREARLERGQQRTPAKAEAAALAGQVGQGLGPAERRAQVGIGRGGRREGRRVAAIGAVRVRRGGDPVPGRPDVVVSQVRAGEQAQGAKPVSGPGGAVSSGRRAGGFPSAGGPGGGLP